MKAPLFALPLVLAACVPAGAGGIEGTWELVGIEGQKPLAALSISFEAGGKVSGQAPCNRFFATYAADPPAFTLNGLGTTRMACPDLAVEQAYLEALSAMHQADLDQGHLFLIGAEGRVLEFARAASPGEPCLSCLANQ